MRLLNLYLLLGAATVVGLVACSDDETGDATTASTTSGTGASTTSSTGATGGDASSSGPGAAGGQGGSEGGAGGAAGGDGGTGGQTECISCMTFMTEPGMHLIEDICEGPALDAWNEWVMCVCGTCGVECATGPCMGNPPGDQACIDCKMTMCADQMAGCLGN